MDQEQKSREQSFIRALVPDWRLTRERKLRVSRIAILVIIVVLSVLLLLYFIALLFGVTLWNVLKVMAVPITVGAAVPLLTWLQKRRELYISEQRAEADKEGAEQRAQHEALQSYLDHMSDLMADKDRPLRRSDPSDTLSTLARARTLTVLARLDADRKGRVVQFLYEAGLVLGYTGVCQLSGADLKEINLSTANLREIDLSEAVLKAAKLLGADLSETKLRRVDLEKANLTDAKLFRADLRGANLKHADLSWANLKKSDLSAADLTDADLRECYLEEVNLSGTRLSDTNLSEANLLRANLRYADLSGANLQGVIFERADLRGANLQGAKDLNQGQIERTVGGETTTLPEGLDHPGLWSKSLAEQIEQIKIPQKRGINGAE